MIIFDDVVKENMKKYNPDWPKITDHPYKILLIEGSGYRKRNSLFNLINYQSDIDKIYLYDKNSYEAKYQSLIKKRENVGTNYFNDLKVLIQYSNNIANI